MCRETISSAFSFGLENQRHISRRGDAYLPQSFLQFIYLCLNPCNIFLLFLDSEHVVGYLTLMSIHTLGDVRAYIADVVEQVCALTRRG